MDSKAAHYYAEVGLCIHRQEYCATLTAAISVIPEPCHHETTQPQHCDSWQAKPGP